MNAAPSVAIFADGNEDIAFSYLNIAGIPDSLGQAWPLNRDNTLEYPDHPDVLTVAEVRGPTDESRELQREELARKARATDTPFLGGWYRFKDQLNERNNFEFGVAYTAVYQHASEDIIGGARGVLQRVTWSV